MPTFGLIGPFFILLDLEVELEGDGQIDIMEHYHRGLLRGAFNNLLVPIQGASLWRLCWSPPAPIPPPLF